jgi:hypothetical protein
LQKVREIFFFGWKSGLERRDCRLKRRHLLFAKKKRRKHKESQHPKAEAPKLPERGVWGEWRRVHRGSRRELCTGQPNPAVHMVAARI